MKWRIKILFAGGVLALILVGVAMAGPAWVADHAIILSTVVSAIAAVVIACFTFELAGATRGLKVPPQTFGHELANFRDGPRAAGLLPARYCLD
jgi:hypothetical protein